MVCFCMSHDYKAIRLTYADVSTGETCNHVSKDCLSNYSWWYHQSVLEMTVTFPDEHWHKSLTFGCVLLCKNYIIFTFDRQPARVFVNITHYNSAVQATHHYSDVIMSAVASQMTGVSINCSTVYSGRSTKYQSTASLVSVRGIYRSPVASPHKGPATQKMFPFDDVIMISRECCIQSTLCCVMVCLFISVPKVYFTGSVAIKQLLQFHWSNLKICIPQIISLSNQNEAPFSYMLQDTICKTNIMCQHHAHLTPGPGNSLHISDPSPLVKF